MTRWPVDAGRITQYLADMIHIDSVNPALVPGGAGEAAMAAWLAHLCETLGLEVSVQEVAPGRPNVIARWPGRGGGRSLLLTGHTDVVGVENMSVAPFTPRIEAGRLYGRGAFDMKGGLASILGAVLALQAGGFEPAGDLILGFVVDEEHASIGTEALVEAVQPDAAILTEPTGLQVCIAHKGFAWLTLNTQGKAAHGSLHEQGIDAIAHMGRVLRELERIDREVLSRRSHPLLGRPSVHASLIDGGLELSTYPDRCRLQIEHRMLPDETGDQLLTLWEERLRNLQAEDPQFSATVEIGLARPGHEVGREVPIVQTVHRACAQALGEEAAYFGMPGWLDSAILSAAGIPTITFGPGGDGAHAAVEYVQIESVHRCAAVLAEATALWMG